MSQQPITTQQATAESEPSVDPGASSDRGKRVSTILLICALFLAFPLVITDPTWTSIMFFALIFMTAASAWNIFSGYSGYLALGHAVFFGTGGYAVAMACASWHIAGGWPVIAMLPFGGLIAGLLAIPVGLVALRTRRHTFVVVTIAIFFIFQLFATNVGFTGGTSGKFLPLSPIGGNAYNEYHYYVAFALVVLTALLSWAVRRSRFGLQLLAIRDDEDRALGLGVKTRRLKLSAFVLSAIPIGMAGALYFDFIGQIYPNTGFDPLFDLSIALMAFFGGVGTIVGPLFGALVLESLQQYLTQQFSSSATYLIAYGVLFLVVILVMPRGVVPSVEQWRERRRVLARQAPPGGPRPTVGGIAEASG
jgi:branched-chain amino acid transport system permease protein